MKILAQNYSNGNLEMLEVPMITSKNGLLIETKTSLVSVGTEKAMIDVAKKSLQGKALARPDWVKQVIDKVKTEGLMEAWGQSKARLDMPVPLGYSCAGITIHLHPGGTSEQLIKEFENLTGVPVVLNTSFNENEPIVCKPEEALNCFLRTKMDVIVLGNYFIKRN